MVSKRKASEYASFDGRCVQAKTEHQSLHLPDLPVEVLDQILSYVIEAPDCPYLPPNPHLNIKRFFPSSALHVNQYLRQRVI